LNTCTLGITALISLIVIPFTPFRLPAFRLARIGAKY
jgi:hypothetical protein